MTVDKWIAKFTGSLLERGNAVAPVSSYACTKKAAIQYSHVPASKVCVRVL
jgi:hypothetical protein